MNDLFNLDGTAFGIWSLYFLKIQSGILPGLPAHWLKNGGIRSYNKDLKLCAVFKD